MSNKRLRVWWIPQVPGKPFHVEVDSVREGVKTMDTLARYDQFQFENRIKPDYCNSGGLMEFDPEDDTDGPEGSWSDWYDEETGEDDPEQFLADQAESEPMIARSFDAVPEPVWSDPSPSAQPISLRVLADEHRRLKDRGD